MRSPEIVRKLILEAAEQLFSQLGFRKTSIDDIARKARIGKGSIYLHFQSKEAIFAEIVRRVSDDTFDRLALAVNNAAGPLEAVRAFATVKLTAAEQHGIYYNLGNEVITELMPLIDALRIKHIERERTLLYLVIQKGAAQGDLAVGNIEKITDGLMTCLEVIARAAFDPNHRAEGKRTGVLEFLEIFLRGLQKTR